MVNFRKKISCRLISREKDSYNETPGGGWRGGGIPYTEKKNMAYNTGKQTYTILYVGEKSYITRDLDKKIILPQTKSPIPLHKSQMVGP